MTFLGKEISQKGNRKQEGRVFLKIRIFSKSIYTTVLGKIEFLGENINCGVITYILFILVL